MALPPRPPRSPASAWAVLALTAAFLLPAAAKAQGTTDQQKFASENEAAMTRMMDGMAVQPSGDIDQDFAAMMIPHHQGAIDMAMAELRYGRNEQLRRIAQEIIVGQLQEIAAMRLALGQPLPPSAPAPTQPARSDQAPPQAAGHSHATHVH
ncbi:DUF305 domain-containing protein [Cupriavidus sp. WKF15]|uniref:DUF305 domain-containing protein n=1 Tax=Cupriavidus sp. WKF15 TaxID=3032282 RepID=UPI0023E1B125|nr:DUF305 domain-containing protein [Cupriavidus sp. WKF15]WER48080.1 DUF305 domain-containing protein [Cupriavidus sp. WKF15]